MRNRIKRVEVLFEFLRVLVAMVIAYALVLVCISFMVEDSVEGIRLFVLGPFESKRRFAYDYADAHRRRHVLLLRLEPLQSCGRGRVHDLGLRHFALRDFLG